MSRLADELLALAKKREATENVEVNRSVAWRFFAASLFGDATVIAGAMFLAFWLRFRTHATWISAFDPKVSLRSYLPYLCVAALSLLLLFANYGMFHARQLFRFRLISFLVIKGCFLWLVGVLVITKVINFAVAVPPGYFGLATVCVATALLTWRRLLHGLASMEKFSKHLRERIIFVGWNDQIGRAHV